MEVVGGVASVVGILGFTGQALTGLIKLKRVLNDAAAAKDIVTHVLETIDLLRSTLKEVERVVSIIEALPQHQINGRAILETGALKYPTRACARDVTEWISAAKKLDPRSRKGIKAFLRKIKVAAGKESLQSLAEGISSHQQRIGIGLSLLGSTLDVLGIHRLDDIDKGLSGLTEAHLKLNDLINGNQQGTSSSRSNEESLVALLVSQLDPEKIASGNASEASLQSIHESISSLVSSVSQLVAKLPANQQDDKLLDSELSPDPHTTVTPQWGCDGISGLEAAFDGDMCIYCCECFVEQEGGTEWIARGHHLARVHHFGACNLGTTFSSWMSMKQHLSEFHNLSAKAGERDIASQFFCSQKRSPFFERSIEDKAQIMRTFDEHPATSHTLAAEFAASMANSDIGGPELQSLEVCFRDSTLDNYDTFKKKIQILVDSGEIDSIITLLWQIRQKLVCLFEELVVDERYEMPEETLHLRSNYPMFETTKILGSMLLILTEELETKHWRESIEPLFASSTVNMVQSSALYDRINPWLLTVLRYSNNTRIIVSRDFGSEMNNASDIVSWTSSTIRFWLSDGTALTGGEIRQVSDGAIDSRDNLQDSPCTSQNASGKDSDRRSPQFGISKSCQGTKVIGSTYSDESISSLKSELDAKRSPWGRKPTFNIGGSSSGESVRSFRPAALSSEKRVSFDYPQEIVPRANYEDSILDNDDSEIDEDAIEDDEDCIDDWEDEDEDEDLDKPSINEQTFQRVESPVNLTPRRSLLTTMLHQKDRANALATAATASRSVPDLQQTLTSAPNNTPLSASLKSEGSLTHITNNGLKPTSKDPESAAQSMIQSTSIDPYQRALSPRSIRRNMLTSELTVSLRQNLLQERKTNSQAAKTLVKRRNSYDDTVDLKQ